MERMDVDDCFTNVVGTYGRYQILLTLTFGNYWLSSAAMIDLPVFVTANTTELEEYNSARVRNDSSILYEWNLLDEPLIADLIQAIFFAGFLFGVVILGQLSDKYGRKIVFQIGYFILFAVNLTSSFSTSWEMFAAFRFLIGFFGGGLGLVSFVYVQENVGRRWWPFCAAIIGMFTPGGKLLLCLIAYFIPPWRKIALILSLVPIPLTIIALFMKESPRWLYSKNRIEEAEKVLEHIAKKNGVIDPVCKLKPLHTNPELSDRSASLLDVFKNRITLKRLLIMSYLWLVVCFVYYAFELAAGDLNSNLYVSEALVVSMDIPVQFIFPVIINLKWSGRKRSSIFTFILAGISCLLLMMYPPEDSSDAKLALGLVGKLSASFCFSVLYVYSPELFPTYVRNVAMGFISMGARVGGILSAFADSFIQTHSMSAYLTFGIVSISAGLLEFFLPETRGKKPPNSFEDLTSSLPVTDDAIISSSKRKSNEKTPLLHKEDNQVI